MRRCALPTATTHQPYVSVDPFAYTLGRQRLPQCHHTRQERPAAAQLAMLAERQRGHSRQSQGRCPRPVRRNPLGRDMRRLLAAATPDGRRPRSRLLDPVEVPSVDADLPSGLEPDEDAQLDALQRLAIHDVGDDEIGEVSPATVHAAPRARWASEVVVRVDKAAGVHMGLDLRGRAGVFGGMTVEVVAVKHGSSLLGAVYEGDVLLSVDGAAVSDPEKAARLLTAAGGMVSLGVKRGPRSGDATSKPSTPRRSSTSGPRYSLNAMLFREAAPLLDSQ